MTPPMPALQARLRLLDVQAPTPVQQAAIPRVLSGENIAIQSYTGSGKVNPGARAPLSQGGQGLCG